MNKKKSLMSFLAITSFFMPLVSAYSYPNFYYEGQKAIDLLTSTTTPFLEAIIGDYSTSEFFFAKVLLLILLYVVISILMKRTSLGDNKGVVFTVSAVISILAIRFISENQMTLGILLPYGTLGIALTTILPFIVFFYFIQTNNMGGFGRRASWVFFGIVFAVMWYMRSDSLSDTSNNIYIITMVLIFFSLIFDKTIREYFNLHELDIFLLKSKRERIVRLQAKLLEIAQVTSHEADAMRKDITKQLRKLGAEV